MADLTDTITTAAQDPASATVDGRSATARPIGDLIKADQYLAGKAAASKPGRGIIFGKVITPGALSDQAGTQAGRGFDGGPC